MGKYTKVSAKRRKENKFISPIVAVGFVFTFSSSSS